MSDKPKFVIHTDGHVTLEHPNGTVYLNLTVGDDAGHAEGKMVLEVPHDAFFPVVEVMRDGRVRIGVIHE